MSTTESAADVSGAIAFVNSYWQNQSGGKISFVQHGAITPFQRHSSYNCTGVTGFSSFMNSEAKRAGYKFYANTHLMVVFPPDTNCGGMAGLGSVGWSINEGGISWSLGSGNNNGKSTIAHELGHNLSFGHSNFLSCPSANPTFTNQRSYPSSCSMGHYGDVIDVMGMGEWNKLPGALSGAHSVRGGLWTAGTEYDVAPAGTSTHTLTSISSYAGKRGIVVGDSYGNDFFVEFRDYTGDDAGYGALNLDWGFKASTPGVRILRLENQMGYKAFAGDDSHLIGRTVSSVVRGDYKAGESFSNGGVTITVQSIAGGQAVVEVTRPSLSVTSGTVGMFVAVQQRPGALRIGDTVQAILGTGWRADSYSFQWYRGTCGRALSAISGATSQSYTFVGADYKKCIRVKVTGKTPGQSSKSKTTASYRGATGKGFLDSAGTASVQYLDRTSLRAVPSGWTTPGLTYKYQWYRDGKAIKNATKSTYKPVSADRGKQLRVRISVNTSMYTVVSGGNAVANSTPTVYSVTASGPAVISGTVRVGETLSVNELDYSYLGDTITPTSLTRQWYRDGKAIKNATGTTYTLTASDHGKRITVKVTARYHGLLAAVNTSAKTAKVASGVLAGTRDVPVVTKADPPSRTLTASLPAGSITTSGVKVAWQWYSNGVAIKNATKSTFTPATSHYGKTITVRATVTKSKYTTVRLNSAEDVTRDSIIQTWNRYFHGTLQVGATIYIRDRSYLANGVPSVNSVSTTEKFQWYRDGKAISGATSSSYTLVAADVGKKLTAKITFSRPGFLGSSRTSLATPKVGTSAFPGVTLQVQSDNLLPLTAPLSGSKVTVVAPAAGTGVGQDGVNDPAAKRTYQWYRNGKAIKGATKSTYTPVSADRGKDLHVRISITKTGYSEVVRTSVKRNFSVSNTSKPTITGTAKVGQTLTATVTTGQVQNVSSGAWSTAGVTVSYQWLRDGKTISGATTPTYTLKSLDKGKRISVRVVHKHSGGYLSATVTSSQTKKVS